MTDPTVPATFDPFKSMDHDFLMQGIAAYAAEYEEGERITSWSEFTEDLRTWLFYGYTDEMTAAEPTA